MRVENLEFIRNPNSERGPEIIQWGMHDGAPIRFTILFWRKDREGWHIEFVGSRPLEVDDQDVLFKIMRYGQAVLDAEFQLFDEG